MIDNPILRQLDHIIRLTVITHCDAIAPLGFFRRNIILDDVPPNFFYIAFHRVAVAAAAR